MIRKKLHTVPEYLKWINKSSKMNHYKLNTEKISYSKLDLLQSLPNIIYMLTILLPVMFSCIVKLMYG